MNTSDDLGEMGIIALVLLCVLGAVLTYPCLVVAHCLDKWCGIDAGFWSWIISMGILWLLIQLRCFWLVAIIYLATLIPFIFIAIEFWKECYGG